VLNIIAILNPWYWAFYIPYAIWGYFDSAPYTQGRPIRWLKRFRYFIIDRMIDYCSYISNRGWRYFRDYFPIKLKVEQKLDPDRQYFFAVHPHGIMVDSLKYLIVC